MKALFLEGKQQLSLKHIAPPIPEKNTIIVTIETTGIGGSEYLGFNNPGIRPLPNIMGHGFTGTRPDGKRVAINPLTGCGNCSYCANDLEQLCEKWKLIGVHSDGGFTEQIAIPEQAIYEIPDQLSWEQSSFIEPFANAIHAWELAQVKKNQSILIIGAGSIGLGLVASGKQDNHPHLHVLEPSATRQAAALELNAKIGRDIPNTYDIVFDTVGSITTRNKAIALVKKNGKCVFVGFVAASQEVNFSELIRFQYQFIGSFVFSKDQFEKAIQLASLTNKKWVKNLTFLEVEQQLRAYLANDFSVVKSVLRPKL